MNESVVAPWYHEQQFLLLDSGIFRSPIPLCRGPGTLIPNELLYDTIGILFGNAVRLGPEKSNIDFNPLAN